MNEKLTPEYSLEIQKFKDPRPTQDEYYLEVLRALAKRSTCSRRAVGCIIVDERGQVLATGYNGVPRGFEHCGEPIHLSGGQYQTYLCAGANDVAGDSSRCMAVHAEQNALLQCSDLRFAHTMYVSCTPCFVCSKMIANTPIRRVVCIEHYAEQSGVLQAAGVEIVVANSFKA